MMNAPEIKDRINGLIEKYLEYYNSIHAQASDGDLEALEIREATAYEYSLISYFLEHQAIFNLETIQSFMHIFRSRWRYMTSAIMGDLDFREKRAARGRLVALNEVCQDFEELYLGMAGVAQGQSPGGSVL